MARSRLSSAQFSLAHEAEHWLRLGLYFTVYKTTMLDETALLYNPDLGEGRLKYKSHIFQGYKTTSYLSTIHDYQ